MRREKENRALWWRGKHSDRMVGMRDTTALCQKKSVFILCSRGRRSRIGIITTYPGFSL